MVQREAARVSFDPEKRLAELRAGLSDNELYELQVLLQIVAMPNNTQNDRDARLVAWQRAMDYAPPAS